MLTLYVRLVKSNVQGRAFPNRATRERLAVGRMMWRGESYHAGAELLQQTRALRARGRPARPDALHTSAEQEWHAAARVWHAAALQKRTLATVNLAPILRHRIAVRAIRGFRWQRKPLVCFPWPLHWWTRERHSRLKHSLNRNCYATATLRSSKYAHVHTADVRLNDSSWHPMSW